MEVLWDWETDTRHGIETNVYVFNVPVSFVNLKPFCKLIFHWWIDWKINMFKYNL